MKTHQFSQKIKESEPEEIPEFASSLDLIKCHRCDLNIKLEQKAIRESDFWFHDKCFEKNPFVKTQVFEIPVINTEKLARYYERE